MPTTTRSGKSTAQSSQPNSQPRGRSRRDPAASSLQEQDTPLQSVESQASSSASAQGHAVESTRKSTSSASLPPASARSASENPSESRYNFRSSRSVSPNLKIASDNKARSLKRSAPDDDDEVEEVQRAKKTAKKQSKGASRKKQKSTHTSDDETPAAPAATRGGRAGRGRGGRAGKAKASAQLEPIEESPLKGPAKHPDGHNPWVVQGSDDEDLAGPSVPYLPEEPTKSEANAQHEVQADAHAQSASYDQETQHTPSIPEQHGKGKGRAVELEVIQDSQADIQSTSTPRGPNTPPLPDTLTNGKGKAILLEENRANVLSASPTPKAPRSPPLPDTLTNGKGKAIQLEVVEESQADVRSAFSTPRAPRNSPPSRKLTESDIVSAADVLNMPDPVIPENPTLYNSNKRKQPHDGYESLSDSEVPNYDPSEWRYKRDVLRAATQLASNGHLPRRKKAKTNQREPDASAQRNSTSASSSYTLLFPASSSKPELRLTDPTLIDELRALAEWKMSNVSNTLPTAEEIISLREPKQQNTSGTYRAPEYDDSSDESGMAIDSAANDAASPTKINPPIPSTETPKAARSVTFERSTTLTGTLRKASPGTIRPLFAPPETPKAQAKPADGWFTSVKKAVSFKIFGRPDETPENDTPAAQSTFTFETERKLPATPHKTSRAAEHTQTVERVPQTAPAQPRKQHKPPPRLMAPYAERKRARVEKKKQILREQGIEMESPKTKIRGEELSEKHRGKLPCRSTYEDEEPGFVPFLSGHYSYSEEVAESRGQQDEYKREGRAAEEARTGTEEHNRARVFKAPQGSDSDPEDEKHDEKNPGPSENAPPALICPPRPTRDWENDDRWGFTILKRSGGLTRESRLLAREPKGIKKSGMSMLAPLPTNLARGPKDGYVPISVEVQQWIDEVKAWKALSQKFEEGVAEQADIDGFNALIQSNLDILRNPPPPPPKFVNPHAPKTPSGLRFAEKAYSSPMYESELEIEGTGMAVSDKLRELVNLSENAPVMLPVHQKTDMIECPAWLRSLV